MALAMSGLDYDRAPVALRERLSFTKNAVADLDRALAGRPGVEGAVLLSTCNRTEVYLSGGVEALEPGALLCQAAGADYALFAPAMVTRRGEDCVRHLMEVSCGLRSQILGEDQILTQVKTALTLSREAGAADGVLETLFRTAAACGKAGKSAGRLSAVGSSAAHQAAEALERALGPLTGKRVLVIGNGEMGRLAASLLREAGCAVTVTLRSYRHGETIVPAGCAVAAYEERYGAMEQAEAVVSATVSPHYTVAAAPFGALKTKPRVLVDLAIPRDIQPEIGGEFPGVVLWNIDDLRPQGEADSEALWRVRGTVEAHMERFRQWSVYRESLPALEEVKAAVLQRVRGLEAEEAAVRAVELLAGGLKAPLTQEALRECAAKIRAHARGVRRAHDEVSPIY